MADPAQYHANIVAMLWLVVPCFAAASPPLSMSTYLTLVCLTYCVLQPNKWRATKLSASVSLQPSAGLLPRPAVGFLLTTQLEQSPTHYYPPRTHPGKVCRPSLFLDSMSALNARLLVGAASCCCFQSYTSPNSRHHDHAVDEGRSEAALLCTRTLHISWCSMHLAEAPLTFFLCLEAELLMQDTTLL